MKVSPQQSHSCIWAILSYYITSYLKGKSQNGIFWGNDDGDPKLLLCHNTGPSAAWMEIDTSQQKFKYTVRSAITLFHSSV